jgi:hypothetical protein
VDGLDSRFRGNDRRLEGIPIPNDTSTHSALQEIQTFTDGRLGGITAKLTVRLEEATYFDRKEKLNGSSAPEPNEAPSPTKTTPGSAPSNSPSETPPPENGTRVSGGNGFAKPRACGTPSSPAPNNGNGSAGSSGFNQFRNEFLTAAWRVATANKQAIGEVVDWASAGTFKYGDIGRMTETHVPKLRAATEVMALALAGTAR